MLIRVSGVTLDQASEARAVISDFRMVAVDGSIDPSPSRRLFRWF
jgi:hypothetical protein